MPKRHHLASESPEPDSDDQDQLPTPTSKRPRRSDVDEKPANAHARRASQRRGHEDAAESDDDMYVQEEGAGAPESSQPEPSQSQQRPELDEEQFEERYEEMVRDLVTKAKRTRKHGTVAEHGIIESIEAHQFMCHHKLKFDFGPQLNFLIGHNGSGKSAVLSAITVALGGKASSTGRGNGLKSFIREGQNAAEVTITIKNKGPEAYRHDEYGDRIQITRRFTSEGASTWKIKGQNGKVISTKKEELSAICDHMNLQVDNPMTVLTQDAARQFLSASGPQDKYNLFMRGTLLQHLHDEYTVTLDNIRATNRILDVKKGALPDLKAKVRAAKTRYEEATKARDQKKKVEELTRELAWSFVKRKETELGTKLKELAKLESRLPQFNDKIEEADREIAEAEAVVRDTQRDVDSLVPPEDLTARKQELDALIKENTVELRSIQADIKEINQQVRASERQIQEFEQQIADETRKLEAQTQKDHRALQQKIDDVKADIEELERRRNEFIIETKRIGVQTDNLKNDGQDKERRAQELQHEIKQMQQNIEAVRQQEKDSLVPYGRDIRSVLTQINNMRWHGEAPVGPLGTFVKARDAEKWGHLLRNQLSQFLTAFAITDARDRPALQGLLQRTGNRHVRIIISEKDIFDFSAGEPPGHVFTVLRALDISNEYVTRILVNQLGIERVVLAHTRREAEDTLNALGGGQAWTLDKFVVRVYGDGVSSTKLDFRNLHPSMQLLLTGRDTAGQIRMYEDEIQRAQSAHQEALRECNHVRSAWTELKRTLDNRGAEERRFQDQIYAKRREHTQLQSEVNDEMPVNLAAIQSAMNDVKAEKENLVQQFQQIHERHVEIGQKNNGLVAELSVIKTNLSEHQNQRNGLLGDLEKAKMYHMQKTENKNHYLKKQGEEKMKIEEVKAVADLLQQEFAAWVEKASKFGDRVENPGDEKVIQRKIDSVNAALKEREKRHGASVEEMAAELNKAQEEFTKVKRDLDQLATLNTVLNRSIQDRLRKWEEFRRHIALRCKVVFALHLSQRGYYGKSEFDHKEGKLTIRVQTDDQIHTQGATDKDPRSLSGGEKSFSTICLLLALWESIGCPLRCLDEFDVFMDAVNRRISMNMMIETANSSDQKQYILITPQDISGVNATETVRILRMADPERGDVGAS